MVEGTQIGAYRVLKQIGEGGMGSVWLAEHAMLGRRAAIKVLHPEYSQRQDVVARFFNEARAATAISDPGIVQIFDFGHHTDGSAYIAMELLEGEPLDRRLERGGALPLPDALRIMRQVASSLGSAHAHGIIHRDLKPENIYLVRDPEVPGGERVKILDFGIAKLTGDTAANAVKTQASALMGTPTYMSPEQCRGAGQVDQRSDVYALGCVLFTLLTGRPPFIADGIGSLLVKQMTEQPPAPSWLRPGLPPEVDQLVLRCLAKDPAARFASGAELAIAIGQLIGSSPQLGVGPSTGQGYVPGMPTTLSAAAAATSTAAPAQGRGKLVAIAGAVVVGAGIAIAVVVSRGGSESTGQAASPVPAPAPAPAPTPPPAHDKTTDVPAHMKDVLARFVAWSHDHAGEACPDAAALGAIADPWGHVSRITCTDQPGDQIVGVVSAGADGVAGDGDDIASWQLGREVTDLVHGARWTVAAAGPKSPQTKPHAPKPPTSGGKPGTGGIQLDENGMPISR
jgi:serine/threonine-protein kinase